MWCLLYYISRVIFNLKFTVGVWPVVGDGFPLFPTCAAHSAHLLRCPRLSPGVPPLLATLLNCAGLDLPGAEENGAWTDPRDRQAPQRCSVPSAVCPCPCEARGILSQLKHEQLQAGAALILT